jgi:hypothetical protein
MQNAMQAFFMPKRFFYAKKEKRQENPVRCEGRTNKKRPASQEAKALSAKFLRAWPAP